MPKSYRGENSKGGGDATSESTRIAVPSARKFTPKLVRDDTVQLKLKKALDEMEPKQLKKAKSVAEITPTKHRPIARVKQRHDVASAAGLHATPRPPVGRTPSGRDVDERRLESLVCRRALLFVWRRSRRRLAMLSESLRRRQEQVFQLESQVSCLKNLTQSECSKRNEAMVECQKMETALQELQRENTELFKEKISLQDDLAHFRKLLHDSSIEVENLKNDKNTYSTAVKRLELDLNKEKLHSLNIGTLNSQFAEKIKNQDELIEQCQSINSEMKSKMENAEQQLQAVNRRYQTKQEEYEEVEQLLKEAAKVRSELMTKMQDQTDHIDEITRAYEASLEKTKFLENELAEARWWGNVRSAARISWRVLQDIGYLMLPTL